METRQATDVATSEVTRIEATESDQRGERSDRRDNRPDRQKKTSFERREVDKYDFEGLITNSGVLEIMPDGYGFLRSSDYNYLNSPMIFMFPRVRSNCLVLKQGTM